MTTPTQPLRVLVAEDDVFYRDVLTGSLRALGHDIVAEAATGREAIALTTTTSPDAVLLDIHMPDGSGLEAAEAIARTHPNTAIVFLSGDVSLTLSDEDVTATRATAFLPKPAPPTMLDSTLRLAVRRTREMQSAEHEVKATRQAMEDRKAIERAKGILMRRTGLTEQEAYRILQRTSQDRSVPMARVAHEVLASEPGYTERRSAS